MASLASGPSRDRNRLRAAVGAEQIGVEGERRCSRCAIARDPAFEPRRDARGCALVRGAARSAARHDPRRARTARLRQAEQRALEHGREREIVFRQQQRVGERHHVHHRDVLGEHQPVGAGDVDAGVLERADDGFEQGPRWRTSTMMSPGCTAWRSAPCRPGPCARSTAARPSRSSAPADPRARLRGLVERRVPAFGCSFFVGLDQRPDLDHARRGVGQRQCAVPAVVGGHAAKHGRRSRTRARPRQHAVARSERDGERARRASSMRRPRRRA